MNLVIVESPTKARTISQFLAKDYKVESSYGHIRDLPKSKLGIDVEKNFEPQYIIPLKARKRVNRLKKEAEKAAAVILATDEDREGEAIAWHLTEALGFGNPKSKILNPNVQRIVFHEITKSAIEEALENPRDIDMNLVDSQQARRVLDRLVGYKLSPFLWEKVMKRLSAGRVQSVALRLIVEREEEIRNFKPEEYWTIETLLQSAGASKKNQFGALLHKINDEIIPKLGIKTKEEAGKIVDDLQKCEYKILKIEKKEIKKNPLPPFITSTLQQEAFKRLRFSAKQTMRIAQNLYENGLITYMRTDSLNISKESVRQAAGWIEKNLGKEYVAQAPRFFKTKSRLAQEAHEAIRPTNPDLTPEKVQVKFPQEKRLYELIWRRFIASQLPQAIFDATRVEIKAQNSKFYILIANGNTLRFDGFLKIWPMKFEEIDLPVLKENGKLKLIKINPFQHFTEPPARYNEASLIKTLEKYGIGRPSTYAPIISVIQERNYVYKNEERRFQPTEIGEVVNKILVKHFPEVVDIQFTAEMEKELDEIAQGSQKWQKVIKEFYEPFNKNLEQKYQEVEKQKPIEEKTEEICEKCGKSMVIKYGRFGKFLACSGFPECKNTKTIKIAMTNDKGEEIKCPKCQTGTIVRLRTKTGRFFYGCSRYPKCDFASWTKPSI
ncbi:DNA topoisomerase I [Candidatus Wolfebacteria bacterium CG18_big_fil_WC_8_21_14_2_50_39_7]|uniref:DNA topoisomerase 1 n=5 Tax=Candidatus Wolfeibacteriota TaxID=1752735 RepID=A0A2M7Q759_9BACT|nr:type I DNA topoisomerase [Parcubacteria group bacterium]NCO89305.1 type I DNA topoisomerase [Candidatus Wolfebacteria bacterium]OIO65430.1 MAG: DNA topoisomerase I [Candidatus Wolfebacteria bacterium CG1_02_39_135]PIP92162.1 MAG: DNA topoisomerase I [Candidatus Wolfebacteria bacterium CG18_big_fil_WC_8_21_14_2_50_39_7]PIU98953.1 MAG: type I DNA topoisomerase [Candidatus Wolfebacteria bacterium CG03_land_8_20_14_0_80_39_317]PIY59029.1 MAG: type I DNA topoisomerase [Candidatus Wolfebacteria b